MANLAKIARRTFLIGAATVAGGVAVGYWYVKKPYPNPLEEGLGDGEATFNPYVKVAADNTITVIAPRAEMGQGIATTLATFVAEELDVDLDRIKVEHGPASWAYFNAAMMEEGGPFPFYDESITAEITRSAMGGVSKVIGLQGTGGSASARDGYDKMRQAGAAARQMLLQAGAQKLGVSVAELTTDNGTIVHKASNRTLTYGDVALAAGKLSPPAQIKLRDKSQWTRLGKPQNRVDMRDKVTGAPIFGVDVRLPDMLYGTVKMSPVFWGKPVKVDLSKAEKVRGVLKIVPISLRTGDGFGVIAENTWAAFKAADLIEVEWSAPDYPADMQAVSRALQATLSSSEGAFSLRNDGEVDKAFADAPRDKVIEANYEVPYLAHATMEPMNATARLKDGVLDIWSPNQGPTIVRMACADAAGLKQDKVNVHTTSMGGGFGRRIEIDFSVAATLLAKEAVGRAVKVTWTREEDMQHDAYRPAAAGRFKARLGDDGLPIALDMRIASPSIVVTMLRRTFPSIPAPGSDRGIVDGAFDQPYGIAHRRVTGILAPISIPTGFWRSVGASFNGFFHEAFMDEIATAGKIDPIAMRRKLMSAFPAAVAVVDKVAAMSKWGEALPAGTAKGFAFTLAFGSWIGQVIQVSQTPAGLKLDKMWIAAEVGTALDPGILEAQIVSGAVFGLSAAMGQEITFKDGKVEQSNFSDYDAMRIFQCPEFEVAILENYHRMGGAGEVGTPPAAPALANAIFALTGKRIRSLPLSRDVSFA